MELKKILNQNLQKPSRTLSHFSKLPDYIKSAEEKFSPHLILSNVICKITNLKYKRISHLKALYREMLCALMKTPNSGYRPVKSDLIERIRIKKDISRKKRVILMKK